MVEHAHGCLLSEAAGLETLCSLSWCAYGCRTQSSRAAWAAAILKQLSLAPERPGNHMMPAFRLLANLCKPQNSVGLRPTASSDSSAEAGVTAAGPTDEWIAAEAHHSEPDPAGRGDAGTAEDAGGGTAPASAGVRLVARLLIQRLLEGSAADPQMGAADLQVNQFRGLQEYGSLAAIAGLAGRTID